MSDAKYEREIEKILTNGIKSHRKIIDLSGQQIKTLTAYKEYYENKPSSRGGKVKVKSVLNSLLTLRELGAYTKKPYERIKQEEIIKFFTHYLKGKSLATISGWKVVVRSFYKWMHGMNKKHEFPPIVDNELLQPEKAKPRKISSGDLFTKDEVLKMINTCRTPMDKAIVSIWYEMGIRGGEYCSLNVDSVEFISGGCKLYIEKSKTEEGYIPLIMAAPYLHEWLNVHPYKDNPKAPLFIGLRSYFGDRLQVNGINQKLKRIVKVAGIKKHIFTHLGRNISITRLDGQLSVEDNARLHGITPSTVFNVYTRRTRREACKKYFDVNGRVLTDDEKIKEKEEAEKLLPKKCISCGTINSYDRNYCQQCLRPIDMPTMLKLGEIKEKQMVEMKDLIKEQIKREIIAEMKETA